MLISVLNNRFMSFSLIKSLFNLKKNVNLHKKTKTSSSINNIKRIDDKFKNKSHSSLHCSITDRQ